MKGIQSYTKETAPKKLKFVFEMPFYRIGRKQIVHKYHVTELHVFNNNYALHLKGHHIRSKAIKRMVASKPSIKEIVKWAVENGYGTKNDLIHTEEGGNMTGADTEKVSPLAKKRGLQQLGTLGAGNHFLEIQRVGDIIDEAKAKEWGVTDPDQILIMLHCGSRGLGHQVATDYLKIQEAAVKKYNISIPDRQLACAPANSKEGRDFFAAMQAAVNFSFANRQVMTHWIRETFEGILKQSWEDMDMHTIYGICHNVIKVSLYIPLSSSLTPYHGIRNSCFEVL